MNQSYTFSRPVPRDPADEYVHDKLFSTYRRVNGLDINPGRISGSHVVTAADDSDENLDFIRDQIVAGVFGYVPGVHQQYVRDVLRPASRGQGRDRWR
jgi:hypothetical protein